MKILQTWPVMPSVQEHIGKLECDGEYVEDETPPGFHAPTVPAGKVHTVRKRNYKQNLDRMAFTGVMWVPKVLRNGRVATKKEKSNLHKRYTQRLR